MAGGEKQGRGCLIILVVLGALGAVIFRGPLLAYWRGRAFPEAKIRELEESRSVHADVLRELYKVKGIGPARAKALVDAGFKTAEDFHHATAEQLLAVKGITKRIAEDLVKHFKGALVEAR